MIGGGTRGLGTEDLYASPDIDVVSFDVYASEHTHFVADAHRIPLADGSVDAIWIQYVLEHVLDPRVVSLEIARVLRPGGIVFSELPFLQQVHEGAYDFTRYTHSGHRWLFREFEEIDSGVGMGIGAQMLWTIDYAVRGVTRSRTAGKVVKLLFVWLRLLDSMVSSRFALDSASSTYFIGRRSSESARPLDAAAMVDYYAGADQK